MEPKPTEIFRQEEDIQDDTNFDAAGLVADGITKSRARERRREDRKHNAPTVHYNQERRKQENSSGNLTDTHKYAVDARTSKYDAVQAELAKNNYEYFDERLTYQEAIRKFSGLFDYLHESTFTNPNVEAEFAAISDTKQRLQHLLSLPLADKVRLLDSGQFDYANYDNFMKQLQFQQDFIDGKATVQKPIYHYDAVLYAPRVLNPEATSPHDVSLGINRASLRAAMIGTPEYGAYKMARQISETRDEEWRDNNHYGDNFQGRAKADYPDTSGYESHVQGNDIGDWEQIIDEYATLATKIANRNPDLSPRDLEYKTVRDVAHIYAKSMEYQPSGRSEGSPYVSSFHESVAWAQLGAGVQAQLRGMRQKIMDVDLHNIERFIGKSGSSIKLASYKNESFRLGKQIEVAQNGDEAADELLARENGFALSKQEKWKERELARVAHKYEKKISQSYDPERQQQYRQEQEAEIQKITSSYAEQAAYLSSRDMSSFIRDMSDRKGLVDKRTEKRKSIAEKAIDLHFAVGYAPFIDWINDMPFGTIKRAHKQLRNNAGKDKIKEFALTEIFSQQIPEDKNLPKESLAQVIRYFQDQGVNDPEERKVLARQIDRLGMSNYDENNKFNYHLFFDHLNNFRVVADDDGMEIARSVIDKGLDFSRFVHAKKLGMSAETGLNFPWLMRQYDGANSNSSHENLKPVDAANNFPLGKNESARHKWCSDHSFVHLDGDWGRQTIGKLIYTRLQAGVDQSLHDATQWLETFQIPETSYNIRHIKEVVKNGDTINDLDAHKLQLKNGADEIMLLSRILSAPEELRGRLLLSRKEQNINKLLSSPENMLIYQQLADIYRNPELNYDILADRVRQNLDEFYDKHLANTRGKDSAWRIGREAFSEKTQAAMAQINLYEPSEGQHDERIGDIMQRLNQYGENRKAYIDDATSWLVKHGVSPQQTLTLAWGDRALALSEGTEDTASAIKKWHDNAAFRIYVRNNPDAVSSAGLSEAEILTTYQPFVNELARAYSVEKSLKAIGEYKRISNPDKIMPPQVVALHADQRKYSGEIFSYDDPRGMTIGYDTGCCMTIGGAGKSCIKSGYQDSNAGFFALYNDAGSIVAQSYFYIDPGHPDTVVIDNIEANQGRDSNRIIDLYKEYFTKYLGERFESNPNWQVRQVNIGTGYGDVAKPLVLRLPETSIVKNKPGIYTDANKDQRLLLKLSDEQIAKAKAEQNHEQPGLPTTEITHRPTSFASPLDADQIPLLRDLESKLYPENMRQYSDDDFIHDELAMPGVSEYSFLINSQIDAEKEAIGYCLAYEAKSESDPSYQGPVVYVADFGILPDERVGMAAMKGLGELLERVKENNIEKVEMGARESTSYRLLASKWGERYLQRHGFRLVDHGETDNFGKGEKTFLLSFERVDQSSATA